MPELKFICDMYTRIENEIAAREVILTNLKRQFTDIVEPMPAGSLKKLDVSIPASIRNSRQRVNQQQEEELSLHMLRLAEATSEFTRSDMIDALSDTYPGVSVNITNRIFDSLSFVRKGAQINKRGAPIVYSWETT